MSARMQWNYTPDMTATFTEALTHQVSSKSVFTVLYLILLAGYDLPDSTPSNDNGATLPTTPIVRSVL